MKIAFKKKKKNKYLKSERTGVFCDQKICQIYEISQGGIEQQQPYNTNILSC